MLKKKITEDLKSAQKTKDTTTVSVIRMLLAEMKNLEIAGKKDLTEEQALNVVLSQAKKHEESIAQFKGAGRDEMAAKETAELEVLKQYLPEQLDEEAVRAKVKIAVSETQAQGPQDMGKVMGAVMPKLKGKASGTLISQIVKNELTKIT